MLLSVSESLTQFGDWIGQYCAELGITISIPILIGFICKLLFSFVKNKQVIKGAVLSATNTLKEGINALKEEILRLKTQTDEQMANLDAKIDSKFDDLRQKRKELYNEIMNGTDIIEEKSIEALEKAEDEVIEVEAKTVETIDNIPEIIEENPVDADDIMR